MAQARNPYSRPWLWIPGSFASPPPRNDIGWYCRQTAQTESTSMSKGLVDLISILDLEPIEVNMFRGNSPKTSWQRVFGGQVIGQAMVAACRTVEGRLPHSLHCYFILPGDPQIPIIYEVERLRDGRSYSTRRVTAIQHGNAIFSIMVSFHVEEEG